jgi:predicted Rdx family selenoprotein
VADTLKRELGLDAELQTGQLGEFTVWVDGRMVAEKRGFGFPAPQTIVDQVRQAIQNPPSDRSVSA